MDRTLHVLVVNESTVLTDNEVFGSVPDFQHQMSYHFQPYWGQGVTLYTTKPSVPVAEIHVLDNSDQAGALGYHDWTTAEGHPLAKVFVKTDRQYGLSWQVTLSHELCEMAADPYIHDGTQDDITGWWYAREVCDAVEADNYGYLIGSTIVSNFVTPMWFHNNAVGPYDYRKQLTSPLSLEHGGYISYWNSTGWHSKQMSKTTSELRSVTLEDSPRFHRVAKRATQISSTDE